MIVVIPDTVVIDSPRLAIVIAASARAEGAEVYCAVDQHGAEARGMLGPGVIYASITYARALACSYWIDRHA